MKRTIIQFISFLLILTVVIVPLVSCGTADEDQKTPDGNGPVAADGTEVGETEADTTAVYNPFADRANLSANLPEVNMDGFDFRIYHNSGSNCIFPEMEKETGDPVDDAFFRIQLDMNERFGADVSATYISVNNAEAATSITKLINARDDTYSLVCCADANMSGLSLNGFFMNIYTLNHLDFDQPWWNNVEELSFMDQCYLFNADFSTSRLRDTLALVMNKDILTKRNIELPYQDVIDGTWTIDKLINITKDIYEDLNANSQRDDGDLYGFISSGNMYGYLESFNIDTLIRDEENGELSVEIDQDLFTTIVDKLYSWQFESVGAINNSMNNDFAVDQFQNQEVAIIQTFLSVLPSTLRHVENLDYGVLPMPKWDESQEEYRTRSQCYPLAVPTTVLVENIENITILIEALAAEGYKKIAPAYFEISMKSKYTTDAESMAMLDVIDRASASSFAWTYEAWKGFNYALGDMVFGANFNFASYYASKYSTAAMQAKKVTKSFQKMA